MKDIEIGDKDSDGNFKSMTMSEAGKAILNIADEKMTPLDRFKLLKKMIPENPRPVSGSQNLRKILASTKKVGKAS